MTSHWPTFIHTSILEKSSDKNDVLLEVLKYRKSHESSLITTNRRTWRSKEDVFVNYKEQTLFLKNKIQSICESLNSSLLNFTGPMNLEGWFLDYGIGGYQTPHTHPGSVWSGVYYLSVETKNVPPAKLRLYDPRVRNFLKSSHDNIVKVTPSSGLLVVFPSWLEHDTQINKAENSRISIAFNVGHSKSGT